MREINPIDMKKLITLYFLILTFLPAFSQTETREETLPDFDFQRQKSFDGFILDMGTMLDASLFMPPPSLTFSPFTNVDFAPAFKINPEAVRLNSNMTYKSGNAFPFTSFYSMLYPASSMNIPWQGASYKLNNGLRINTYGEYDADGYKVYNPAALPWERNNFNAAFEVKSPNGKFGIKVEVHQGRNYP